MTKYELPSSDAYREAPDGNPHSDCEYMHQLDMPELHFTGEAVECVFATAIREGGLFGDTECPADVYRGRDGQKGEIGDPDDDIAIFGGGCLADFIRREGLESRTPHEG